MIRRHSSTAPTLKSPATEAGPQPECGSISTNGIADDTEWERALFLQPARLAEARRHDKARSHRWSGLLLAGLAALAIGVGDVRAADHIPTTGEDSSTAFDYWAWLASWLDGSAENESSLQQKNDEGTTDPGEGE